MLKSSGDGTHADHEQAAKYPPATILNGLLERAEIAAKNTVNGASKNGARLTEAALYQFGLNVTEPSVLSCGMRLKFPGLPSKIPAVT